MVCIFLTAFTAYLAKMEGTLTRRICRLSLGIAHLVIHVEAFGYRVFASHRDNHGLGAGLENGVLGGSVHRASGLLLGGVERHSELGGHHWYRVFEVF